ncbi:MULTISPECIES: TrbC/VirB2 family protein [Caproicibacterium]|uniref:TrbC/VirB2 family protein n=1 Tax=Caproicibacterium argilliputei TaxID=3030016 RepID=A0AA97D9Z6_9FIRM|nr:TrbC/VirB2 family protein [Caproicibacterium argilliputei]WOC32367.1 TrbC/VirB2 family protein [Caproicibacterium argilliputei]
MKKENCRKPEVRLDSRQEHRRKRSAQILLMLLLAALTVSVAAFPCFAADATSQVTKTGSNLVLIMQVIGGIIAVIEGILCGIKFAHGGRDALMEGKLKIVGLVVGIIMIFGSSAIVDLIKQQNAFGGI